MHLNRAARHTETFGTVMLLKRFVGHHRQRNLAEIGKQLIPNGAEDRQARDRHGVAGGSGDFHGIDVGAISLHAKADVGAGRETSASNVSDDLFL